MTWTRKTPSIRRKRGRTHLSARPLEERTVPAVFASVETNVTINDNGPASPYPSTTIVTGLTGQVITDLNVTIKGLTHTQVQDVDILLIAPDGTNIVLMSDNGGTSAAAGVTLTFDDAAVSTIGAGPIASGIYKPENLGAGDVFPGGPAKLPVATLSAFNGLDPNGVWELRVVDDTFLDSGSFGDPLGAWLLDIGSKANKSPVAADDTYVTSEDQTLSVAAKGVLTNDTDGDNDPLTAILVSGPTNGKLTLNPDGSFDYVPASNFNGSDSFSYKATDGLNESNIAKVTITVNPVADPAIAFNDRYVTLQNTSFNRDANSGVLANDQNPDAAPRVRLYYEDFENLPLDPFSPGVSTKGDGTDFAKNLPPGWERTLGPSTPLTGPEEFTGWHVFDIDSWIAQQDDQSRSLFTRGGVGKNGQVLVADGDALDDFTSINPNKYTTLATTRPISLAGVLPNSLRLEFDSSYRPEGAGTQFAKAEVTFDGGSTWNELLFYDTDNTPGGVGSTARTNEHLVFDLDNPPNATSAQVRFSYLEAGNDWWWAIDNVEMTANRTDRKSLTATKVTNPANGVLTLNVDGSLAYTPNAGFVGTDSFTYNAVNAFGFSNIATVQISVVAANPSAPVANADRYTLQQGSSLTAVSNYGFLADDTDPDGDPLFATLVGKPANGSLTITTAGAFTYVPNASFSGIDSFTYTASDGTNLSAVTTVNLVVVANNFTAPVAKSDAFTLNENGNLTVAAPGLLANDSDADGNPLTVNLLAGANRGTLTVNPNGSLTYVPFPGFSGTDSFTYVARDGLFDSNVATVTLTITPDATPFAQPDTYSTKQGQTLTVSAPGVLANDIQAGSEVVLFTEDFESFVLGPYSLGVGGGDGTDWTSFLPAGWTRETQPLPTPLYAASIPPDFAGWNIMDIDSWIANQGGQQRNRFTRGGVGVHGNIIVADGDSLDDFYTTPAGQPGDPGIDPNLYSTVFTTQPVPLAGLLPGSLRLEFDSSFRPEDPGTQFALVDVSFDGGTSWTNLLKYQNENSGGAGSVLRTNERVGLTAPNPSSGSALFRFGYTEAGNDWWWAIDNIRITGETGVSNISAEKVTNPANGGLTLNPDGSFTYIPNPGFFGTDSFTYSAKSGSLVSAPTTVTINVTATQPVRVASVQVNDGSDQRSRVTSLRVAFDQPVSFTGNAADAFQLLRQSDSALVTLAAAINNTGPGTVVTLTFTGGPVNANSLADGRYTLTIDASKVGNANGGLDGNGDGTAGDSFVLVGDPASNKLFRLFGDNDGDGDVDAQDFGAFRAAFGGTTNLAFDNDNDGDVDAQDFGAFRQRFGSSV